MKRIFSILLVSLCATFILTPDAYCAAKKKKPAKKTAAKKNDKKTKQNKKQKGGKLLDPRINTTAEWTVTGILHCEPGADPYLEPAKNQIKGLALWPIDVPKTYLTKGKGSSKKKKKKGKEEQPDNAGAAKFAELNGAQVEITMEAKAMDRNGNAVRFKNVKISNLKVLKKATPDNEEPAEE